MQAEMLSIPKMNSSPSKTSKLSRPVFAVIAQKILVTACLFSALAGMAAESDKQPQKQSSSSAAKSISPIRGQLQELVTQIQEKLGDGKKTEADLAAELKQFDQLLKEHANVKSDDVAQILLMKAMLYVQIFDDTAKGTELIKQLKKDFPETTQGKQVDTILASLEQQEAAKKIQRSLAVGSQFPDFNEKDTQGNPLSLAKYKGKVVLLDFWATWCGPCVQELPNVLSTYKKHHEKGFEIIGISLDESEEKLTEFIKKHKMTWPQFFDGKGWANKLAEVYGVKSIPATYLVDGSGKIIGNNLRGDELESAVAAAVAGK